MRLNFIAAGPKEAGSYSTAEERSSIFSIVSLIHGGVPQQRVGRTAVFSGSKILTKIFERWERPKHCHNCQEVIDHKTYQCTKPQVCGRCAKDGHHHGECTEAIVKCVPSARIVQDELPETLPIPSRQLNERRGNAGRRSCGHPGSPSAEDTRTTPDDPHGSSQVDKDGPADVEGR